MFCLNVPSCDPQELYKFVCQQAEPSRKDHLVIVPGGRDRVQIELFSFWIKSECFFNPIDLNPRLNKTKLMVMMY